MRSTRKKVRIGDSLVAEGHITQEQLMTALQEQKTSHKRLGQVIIDLGYMQEESFLQVQAGQLGIAYISLRDTDLDETVVKALSEPMARRHKAIPLKKTDQGTLVVMADPTDIFGVDEIQDSIGDQVVCALAKEEDILNAIDRLYHNKEEMSSLASELESELGFGAELDLDLDAAATTDTSDAPVVRLLQSIFEEAIAIRASDIHIEPDENLIRVRHRVDGVLHERVMKEKRIASALVMRLKIMSGLDISEKRLPQDGRFQMDAKTKRVDVRLSTLPTQHGESIVMRILDQSSSKLNVKKLGMPPNILSRFELLIKRPHGIILVTGPTGSGKTTTLYSALSAMNAPDKKIITAEDPVEYRLPRIQQVQVNTKVGLDFSGVLRSALRQDPDVVLVGEIRDQETAQIALKAAMTGHLVLSTLHTNDSISSMVRLIDMGTPAYMAATAVLAIVAQRLIRKVCEKCAWPYELTVEEQAWFKTIAKGTVDNIDQVIWKQGAGCKDCHESGFMGRIGVYELLEMNAEMVECLRKDDISGFSKAANAHPNFESLALCALHYAMEGITSPSEVLRLAATLEDVQ